jgi:hypothetical protein
MEVGDTRKLYYLTVGDRGVSPAVFYAINAKLLLYFPYKMH